MITIHKVNSFSHTPFTAERKNSVFFAIVFFFTRKRMLWNDYEIFESSIIITYRRYCVRLRFRHCHLVPGWKKCLQSQCARNVWCLDPCSVVLTAPSTVDDAIQLNICRTLISGVESILQRWKINKKLQKMRSISWKTKNRAFFSSSKDKVFNDNDSVDDIAQWLFVSQALFHH